MLNQRARRAPVARVRAFMGAAIAAAFLSACSGGGGGGGSSSSLAVTPSSTSATPGGAPVALHAALSGSTATPAWTLTGPGTLSASSGTDITYTPPASTSGNEAVTATITVSAAGVSKQAQVALAETDGPGHHWNIGLAPGAYWTDVKWGGGRFVAVGLNSVIVSSADGTHWTHADTPGVTHWSSVAWGGAAGWVALGGDKALATSPDGVTWTMQPTLQANPAASVVAFGNGVFVATSTTGSWVSTDGKAWTAVAAKLSGLAFGNGVFVGVSATGPVASADGRTWPAAASAAISAMPSNDGVAFGKGTFVASSGNVLSSSTDGTTWTPSTPSTGFYGRPTFAVDRFYLTNSGSSADGHHWDDTPSFSFRMGAANADASVVVVTVYDTSTTPLNIALGSGPNVASATPVLRGSLGWITGIDCGRADCLAVMSNYALRSVDRTTWIGSQTSIDDPRLMHLQPYGNFLMGGAQGNTVVLQTSLDGVDWITADSPAESANGDGGIGFAQGPNGLLALAESGDVLTSPNGGTWQSVAHLPVGFGRTVAWAGGRFVALSVGGKSATSTDGVTWTVGGAAALNDASGPLSLTGVVHDGTQFVAVGVRGAIATSPDGLAWTLQTTTSLSTGGLQAIAIAANGEMVAVGEGGMVETSIDGVHWKRRDSGTNRSLTSVVATPGGFYAAGGDNVIIYSDH